MRFAVINTVPPGFCRKMHLLAPGGKLADLAALARDDLSRVGLSPTHMEAIEGFIEWHDRGVSPEVGLLMWYLESTQLTSGAFLRTENAPSPSIGVANRYLQIAGQLGITRPDGESVNRAAEWLENQIDDDGLLRMPISGNIDYGMLARALRSLSMVEADGDTTPTLKRGRAALAEARIADAQWSTYPGGQPSTGATSLAITAVAECRQHFDFEPDPGWLLEIRNDDGGWGEYEGSPSKVDNTFWTGRACTTAGVELDDIAAALTKPPNPSPYELAMAQRLRVVAELPPGDDVVEPALRSLSDEADRYAETCLFGLTLAETLRSESTESPSDHRLPIRTPEFIRQEPPLYDQLGQLSLRTRWLKLIDYAASVRAAEASIGWMAGLWAAIALISEEFVNGLASLPVAILASIVTLEIALALGWLAARQTRGRRLTGVPHFCFAGVLALLVILLLTSPSDVSLSLLPASALTLLLGLIIEVVSVATDKADLLNRLGDD